MALVFSPLIISLSATGVVQSQTVVSTPGAYMTGLLDGRNNMSPGRREIFVALDGDDVGGDGTINSPYQTLQRAAIDAAPGDVIYVRGGLYAGAKDVVYDAHGSAAQPIAIRPYHGETVTFDGRDAGIGDNSSVILICCSSHIVFEGFEVQNSLGRGLSVYESHHVVIRNNRIHDVRSRGLGGGGDNLVFEGNGVWRAVLENEGETMSGGWSAAVSTYRRADGSDSTNITIRDNHI